METEMKGENENVTVVRRRTWWLWLTVRRT
jgi:hypothetical protein